MELDPNLSYGCELRMGILQLFDLINTFKHCGDSIKISSLVSRLKFSSVRSHGFKNGYENFPTCDLKFHATISEEIKIEVDFGYMKSVCDTALIINSVLPEANIVCLSLGNNAPILFEVCVGQSHFIKFYLAPITTSDDLVVYSPQH